MNQIPTIRFTRIRKVKAPSRANAGDAGLDFYFPQDLTIGDFIKANENAQGIIESRELEVYTDKNHSNLLSPKIFSPDEIITRIYIQPNSRVLIPSGIKVLLTPRDSMLQANNKSGISTKKGLIFGAEVVDSPYTGEVHISLINTSKRVVEIKAGEKLIQFIHVPLYLSEPEEIDPNLYDQIARDWGTRGSNGFGSSDLDEELNLRDTHYGL